MNKFGKFALKILGVSALIQLSACTKIYDEIFNDAKVDKKCRIASFTQANIPGGPGTRTAQFYYNQRGDIDSIIADVETGSLGPHLFYFSYDNNHRLISYREEAGQSYPYQEVHTYVYQNGRIIRDSVRIDLYENTQVKTLEYDRQGRVIKETTKILYDNDTIVDNMEPLIFTYDDEGNLVFDAATYDDGVNFLRTNEHLMFTQRNYSRNNRAGATSYNDRGLPLGFVSGIPTTYGGSSLLSFGLPVEIEYQCK